MARKPAHRMHIDLALLDVGTLQFTVDQWVEGNEASLELAGYA